MSNINFNIKKNTRIILVSSLIYFCSAFLLFATNIILPTLVKEFQMELSSVTWVTLIFMILFVGTGLSLIQIIRKIGAVKSSIVALLMIIVSVVILVQFENFYGLLVARFIQGVACSALTITPMMLIIRNIESEEKKIDALGKTVIGLMTGLVAGTTGTGIIVTYLSWTHCFLFLIPFVIITLILLISLLPFEQKEENINIDYVGSLTWFLSVAGTVYGICHLSNIHGWIALGIGIIILSIFVTYELRRSTSKLYDFRLLENKNYAIDNYVAMVISLTSFALPYFFGLYFQYYKLCSPFQTGFIIFFYALFYIMSNIIITLIYSKINIKRLYKFSIGIQPLIILILIFSNQLSIITILILICISAFFNGFADVLNKNFVLGVYGKEKISDTSSFISTVRNYGDLIITGIITLILTVIPETSIHFAPSVMITIFVFILIAAILLFRKIRLNKILE